MIDLKSLAEFLKNSDVLDVTITESGLVITEKEINEKNIIPSDLSSFVSVYEKTEIVASDGGYLITVERMSANNFMKLLNSVFSTEYSFEATGEYEIKATKLTANEDLNEGKAPKDVNMSFYEIAEAIDDEDIEIEIHEDGLKVVCSDLKGIAEKIDSMSSNLDILIMDEYLTVMNGEK